MERVRRLLVSAFQAMTWGDVCVYAIILFISWLVSKVIFLPMLSPLKKIPGRPESLIHILFGHLPEILKRPAIEPYRDWVLEMKTGFIRYRHLFGNYRIMVADADVFKEVMVTSTQHFPRPINVFRIFVRIVGQGLLTLNGQKHSVQRQLCNPAFKLSSLQGLLPVFQKKGERLCAIWTEAINKNKQDGPTVVEAANALNNVTFDVITEAGFGYQANAIEDPSEKTCEAFNYLLSGGDNSLVRFCRIAAPGMFLRLPLEVNRKFFSSLEFIQSIITNIIGQKKKVMEEQKPAGSSSMDLLEMLLSASDVETGQGFTETQLRDHVMTFMLAGHETSASVMTWVLLCLASHPDVQTKARQEVMSCLPQAGQPITMKDLDQLTYLNCVIKETLRLYPVAPIVIREAGQDVTLNGYFVPKGTILNMCVGALHRNPAYWDDPEDFKPERFLDKSSFPFFAYQPFISGPHMCIGYKFASFEMRMVLALLLKQFEFSHLPDVTYRKKQSVTMRPFPALKLNIRRVA